MKSRILTNYVQTLDYHSTSKRGTIKNQMGSFWCGLTEEFCVKPWLVVEDEEDIRNIVKVMFTAWGYTSIDFRDGNQTYAWLDTVEAGTFQGELPDLALLDIKMPGPRGNEIARRMRTMPPFKHIAIVLMTAFTLEDHERQSMVREDGVDYIIDKPLPDFFELKKQLEEVYEKKKMRVSASRANTPVPEPANTPVPEPASTPVPEPAKTTGPEPAKTVDGEPEKAANTSVTAADSGAKTAND
jgi:CheY-like chemotaxis protein